MSNITPFGYNIEVKSGMLSLTDLWKEAGSDPSNNPSEWQRLPTSTSFITAVCKVLNMGKSHIIKSSRGKGGGTFAHPQIAAEYAQYLDPKLAVYVNELFLNPEAATQHAVNVWQKKGKSSPWITERMIGIASRKDFTKTLQNHGVKGSGYSDCTNAIYRPLWGGDAKVVRAKKGISEKANTRESMTEVELAAVRLAELISKETIEKTCAMGNTQCKNICERSGKSVATSLILLRQQKNLNAL